MLYQRGAKGNEVRKIQERLKELGFYEGLIDGDYGGGTETSVKAYQRASRLEVDGQVGPTTWKTLFDGAAIEEPGIYHKPLAFKCLALTGSIETSAPVPECFAGLSGDFDQMGISFGALQWNLGQGSLQPLLKEMNTKHSAVLRDIFDDHYAELASMLGEPLDEQVDWARSIQDPKARIVEPWRGLFKTLGRRPEFQDIEVRTADSLYQRALVLCREYGLRTERAVALLFDIVVQNGSIKPVVKEQITRDRAALPPSGDVMADEAATLRIIANRRAEAANPRWMEDVRTRKLMIANGVGTVHGAQYDIQTQYGIGLRPADELAASGGARKSRALTRESATRSTRKRSAGSTSTSQGSKKPVPGRRRRRS
jgi:antitoxin component of RelBE/YafQ-DinJ toxin-antitoxin module